MASDRGGKAEGGGDGERVRERVRESEIERNHVESALAAHFDKKIASQCPPRGA